VVVELEGGITVYPARRPGDRWRAVWYEGGRRRQCEAVTEDKLAVELARVAERLAADAPGLERPGADLIAWYLSPGPAPGRAAVVPQARRYPAQAVRAVRRSGHRGGLLPGHPHRRHAAHRQRRAHRGEGARLRRCLSALVTAGIAAGYLTSPRLKEVHWQAAGRAAPGPQVAIAGESALFVDPAEIPADHDVARLGRALAAGRRGDLHELMAATAAYAGLRQGELFALTAAQVAPAARVITVDCKVVEVAGKQYLEAPKNSVGLLGGHTGRVLGLDVGRDGSHCPGCGRHLSRSCSRPQNRVIMSMQPQPWPEVPASTAKVAKRAFRKGSLAMRARDELGRLVPGRGVRCAVRDAGRAGDLPGAAGDGDGAAVHREPDRPAGR
jgi:hypothetical protein